jgi:hypothetical protein
MNEVELKAAIIELNPRRADELEGKSDLQLYAILAEEEAERGDEPAGFAPQAALVWQISLAIGHMYV